MTRNAGSKSPCAFPWEKDYPGRPYPTLVCKSPLKLGLNPSCIINSVVWASCLTSLNGGDPYLVGLQGGFDTRPGVRGERRVGEETAGSGLGERLQKLGVGLRAPAPCQQEAFLGVDRGQGQSRPIWRTLGRHQSCWMGVGRCLTRSWTWSVGRRVQSWPSAWLERCPHPLLSSFRRPSLESCFDLAEPTTPPPPPRQPTPWHAPYR